MAEYFSLFTLYGVTPDWN